MRHRVYGKHFGRDKDERENLFKGLVSSLFTHGTIQTSESKAKAIKGLVDKIINLAKDERSSSMSKKTQGKVQAFLTDKNLTDRLIKEIVPKLGSRNSGYTSLIRLGNRLGDQTMIVKMSLIGAEELKPLNQESRIKNQELRKGTKEQGKVTKKNLSKVTTKDKLTRRRVTK